MTSTSVNLREYGGILREVERRLKEANKFSERGDHETSFEIIEGVERIINYSHKEFPSYYEPLFILLKEKADVVKREVVSRIKPTCFGGNCIVK